jgi:alginate O-acetyltransferase complex protein AlgI
MPLIDWNTFFKQFLYDPQNPLLFNNGFFVYFFGLFIFLYYSFRNDFTIRRYIFCFFSLYFFYKASGFFVILVIVSAIVDFILSNLIYRQQKKGTKKLLLVLSICFNLGMLFYFKYTNFFITISNEIFHTGFNPLNILLPVGISFYTFENLSYTIDVYRGEFEPARKFSDYLLFLSFFPKLVMGPIVRAHDFIPQINQEFKISDSDFAKGFYLIISGMFKKLIISDYITLNLVNYVFDDPGRYTGLENLFAVYGYAIVIYCDFSGYSDVALGIAKWMGFNIPTNFLSPYQSKSITEFWRRWHISLSSWLKDYLYIPLGGNRKGTFATYLFTALFLAGCYFAATSLLHLSILTSIIICSTILILVLLPAVIENKEGGIATNFNLITTMILGGLWHGASWNFIGWGILHGLALAVHKIWKLITDKPFKALKTKSLYKGIMVLITFHFVCFCWIFFKAPDFDTATIMVHQIISDFNLNVWSAFFQNYKTVLFMIVFAFITHSIPDNYAEKYLPKFKQISFGYYMLIFFVFVLIYGYFKSSEPVMPIYLQF